MEIYGAMIVVWILERLEISIIPWQNGILEQESLTRKERFAQEYVPSATYHRLSPIGMASSASISHESPRPSKTSVVAVRISSNLRASPLAKTMSLISGGAKSALIGETGSSAPRRFKIRVGVVKK